MFLAILFLLAEIILILTIVFSVMFLPVSIYILLKEKKPKELTKRGKKYMIVSIVFAAYLVVAIGIYAGVFQ